jgi:DNA-binding NtrC family response regulator
MLAKPFHDDSLYAALDNVLSRTGNQRSSQLNSGKTDPFESIIGGSKVLEEVKQKCRRYARLDEPILLLGETGTGKELFAEAIYQCSRRANRRYVVAHIAAMSETQIESSLFGHVKGAFTGAVQSRLGWFKEADRGVIFLDEIGDTALEAQQKLLRVMERKPFRPVGADVDSETDVLIIAATWKDLDKMVEEEKFREDLFFRFQSTIRLPPLRERLEDIEMLAKHFLRLFANELGVEGRVPEITSSAIDVLKSHSWPGNVRDLRRVVRVAMLECGDGPITPENISLSRARKSRESTQRLLELTWKDAQAQFERMYFERLEQLYPNNTAKIAQASSTDPTTVLKILKKLDLRKPKGE